MTAEHGFASILACPVEGCGAALARVERAFLCANRHSFDVSRANTVNLLTPKDKKSANPGDSKEAVRARRRNLERGHGDSLRDALIARARAAGVREGGVLLDVGSGDGFFTRAIGVELGLQAFGLDLSPAAAEIAAKANAAGDPRAPFFFTANADRKMPVRDGSVDLLTSITARRNPAEFARVLAPRGVAMIACPADDDLLELREAVLGARRPVGAAETLSAAMTDRFRLIERIAVRRPLTLDRAAIADWLLATYRGARESQSERVAGLERIETAASHEIFVFERTRGESGA